MTCLLSNLQISTSYKRMDATHLSNSLNKMLTGYVVPARTFCITEYMALAVIGTTRTSAGRGINYCGHLAVSRVKSQSRPFLQESLGEGKHEFRTLFQSSTIWLLTT